MPHIGTLQHYSSWLAPLVSRELQHRLPLVVLIAILAYCIIEKQEGKTKNFLPAGWACPAYCTIQYLF